ncbi:MAG: putative peptide zinc metalloprotease protein [Desulfobacteraceae bacterium Eth-SRB1]|nr:MAG: putative peptide zinc metalloprotease protein [Desulfobacteraceae bacterium Eth-SRB1]
MRGNLFSESWYKVAYIRAGLLNTVDVQKQYYRGDLWYVLQDSFNSNYFRINPATYFFVARMTPYKTVQDVWEECLEIHKDKAPSQDDIIGLLSQLHANNLLYLKNPPNNEFVFERHREKKQKELKSKIFSIIAIKIPLWNPNRWLTGILPFIKVIFNVKGLCLWSIVVLFGAKAVIENFGEVYDQTQSILSPSNLIFVYLALALLKCFHELGHAMTNKRFGGSVPTLGVMFLVFTPLPYMDATTSWFFQDRWKRVLVGSAGMMADLFFAAIAAMVWAHTGDGLLHSLAFNIMIVGSVSSVLFNGNPLIRFDAYYIASDVLEIPNLYQRARQQWMYWAEKYLFHVEYAVSPSEKPEEAAWLALYGVCSLIYRIFLTIVIVLFVADKLFVLGFIIAIISIFAGILIPLKKLIVYLATSPELSKTRKRAVIISAVIAVTLCGFIGLYPVSYTIRAPGIVESGEYSKIYATTEGKLENIYFESGDFVQRGDVIARLSNYELTLQIKVVDEGLFQTRILKQKAILNAVADVKPLLEREKVLNEELKVLEQRKKDLTVSAQSSGVFVSPDIELLKGRWLRRQTQIGSLITDHDFRFYAIVSQKQAFDLFRERQFKNEIKLYGNANKNLKIDEIVVIPYQREELPSAALGWFGGGDISVSSSEKTGKKVTEPFFEINGRIVASDSPTFLTLLHGRSGVLRLTLPPEPLSVQGYRLVKQTIQKRYKI